MLDVISVFQTCIQKCCQRCNTESESEDLRYIVKRNRSWGGGLQQTYGPDLKDFKTDGEKHTILLFVHTENTCKQIFPTPLF